MNQIADYRIICTTRSQVEYPIVHGHIVSVGTGSTPDNYSEIWSVDQVVALLDSRIHRFYTIGRTSGVLAWVQTAWCGHCNRKIIKTVGDVTADNNLDNLPLCG